MDVKEVMAKFATFLSKEQESEKTAEELDAEKVAAELKVQEEADKLEADKLAKEEADKIEADKIEAEKVEAELSKQKESDEKDATIEALKKELAELKAKPTVDVEMHNHEVEPTTFAQVMMARHKELRGE